MYRTFPFGERHHRRQAGATLAYVTVSLTVLIGFASLAVDLGRAQLAKTELRCAADAAARYAAQGYASNSITANAIAAAAQNNVDGTALVLQNSDITSGYWNNGTFSTSGSGTSAVRVRARRLNSRGTGVPMLFAGILGKPTLDITVQAIATYVPSSTVVITAQAKANPWLAGMPNGTTANDFDSSPTDTPSQVTGIPITPGGAMNFAFTGGASYLPSLSANGPDGDLSRMIYNHTYTGFAGGREHGKSNLTAPITSVVGLFLTDNDPTTEGAPPADLDFSTTASRDFSTLSPALRQPFFIGDGLREDNATLQNFIVPAGATRLYIGIMDGQQWSDNTGSFNTNVTLPPAIKIVN